MSSEPLPAELRAFLLKFQLSMDHIAVLLALRSAPELPHGPGAIATRAQVSGSTAASALEDLVRAGLAARDGAGFRYEPSHGSEMAIDQLADLYNTRPVTLVRALYERPSPARSFADAFRIRRTED